MNEPITETQLVLEITVGENFAKLPPEAHEVLFTQSLLTLINEALPRAITKINQKDQLPFTVRVGVGVVNGNSVEGQNIMDDLGIDQESRPK